VDTVIGMELACRGPGVLEAFRETFRVA
jgi:hypothetical protein